MITAWKIKVWAWESVDTLIFPPPDSWGCIYVWWRSYAANDNILKTCEKWVVTQHLLSLKYFSNDFIDIFRHNELKQTSANIWSFMAHFFFLVVIIGLNTISFTASIKSTEFPFCFSLSSFHLKNLMGILFMSFSWLFNSKCFQANTTLEKIKMKLRMWRNRKSLWAESRSSTFSKSAVFNLMSVSGSNTWKVISASFNPTL